MGDQNLVSDHGVEMVLSSDGQTVWVNGPTKMVGRFTRHAAEVVTARGPWYMPHAPDQTAVTREDWDAWKDAMWEHHAVRLPEPNGLLGLR